MSTARELTAESVYALLRNFLSESEVVRTSSETQILALEDRNGFFASLAEVSSAVGKADNNLRWLAAVCMKNAVLRSWRSRDGGITEGEKMFVRQTLISMIGEAEERV